MSWRTVRLMAFDAALANWGVAYGYTKATGEPTARWERLAIKNIYSISTARDKEVSLFGSNLKRARELQAFLQNLVIQHAPDVIFVEQLPGTQRAQAAVGTGVVLGILASLYVPVIVVHPKRVRQAQELPPKSSKRDSVRWAFEKYPTLDWHFDKHSDPLLKNQHMADACGVMEAGLRSKAFTTFLEELFDESDGGSQEGEAAPAATSL